MSGALCTRIAYVFVVTGACTAPYAVADQWVIPAEVNIETKGLRVIKSYCEQLYSGDTITHIDGMKITPGNASLVASRLARGHKVVGLKVKRGSHSGETRTVRVELVSGEQLVKDNIAKLESTRKGEQAAAAADKEKWLNETTFRDNSGRQWTIEQIRQHNEPIAVNIGREVVQNTDANRDRIARSFEDNPSGLIKESAGSQIARGYNVALTMKDILELPAGRTLTTPGGYEYGSLADFAKWVSTPNGSQSANAIELLFDSTDGERYLIPCRRTGMVLTAEEAWEEVISVIAETK